jgi:hypothetical protein
MSKTSSSKDLWDKMSALTPLIIGICITGVGAIFTQIYNYRQLQLSQIDAMDKFRPLLNSEKAEERKFGYNIFKLLGYESMAIDLIKINKDRSGIPLLYDLQKSGSNEIKRSAAEALNELNLEELLNKIRQAETWEGLAVVTTLNPVGHYDPNNRNIYVVNVDISRTFIVSYAEANRTMAGRQFGRDKATLAVISDSYHYGNWSRDATFPPEPKEYRFIFSNGRWVLQ